MWISKEKYEDIERRVKELNDELQRLYNLAYLVDIKQDGTRMVMTFCQGDKIFTIEAVRIISGAKEVSNLFSKTANDMLADGFREVHAITTFNAKNLQDFDGFVELRFGVVND